MKRFDVWLHQHHFIPESETVFQENLAENAPLLIIAFIMSELVLWLWFPLYDLSADEKNCQMRLQKSGWLPEV
jgi:hypothetical protein